MATKTKAYLRLGHLLLAVALMLLIVCNAAAQNALDATTPPGQSPGAPAGAYPLSGFDNVNLFNGHLNFRLPLLQLNGRGRIEFGTALPIEQRWTVNHDSSGVYHFPNYNWWTGLRPGYGPGVLQGRQMSEGCSEGYSLTQGTTRLTFTASDGTEYELRDQIYGGQVASSNCDPFNPQAPGTSRGTTFVTADGSSATFISDTAIYDHTYTPSGPNIITPSGYLMLRDGTRYRIDNGMVTWMRDSNGNKISFTYQGSYLDQRITSATDSLNRQVTYQYNFSDPTYGICDRIIFKGFGGAQRIIRIVRTSLSNALISGESIATYQSLFPTLHGSSSTYHNPEVVSIVWLPNGRSYQFRYNRFGELSRVELPTAGRFEYSWTQFSQGMGFQPEINRRVTERRTYTESGALASRSTYGSYESDGFGTQGTVQADHFDFNGALLSRDKHYFHGHPFSYTTSAQFDLPNPIEGREYKTELFASNGTTILRRIENTWVTCSTLIGTAINPCVSQTITTLEPATANLVSKQTFAYDSYANQIDVYEYGFGSGSAGSLLRRMHTDYLTTNPVNGTNYATISTIHLRSLPKQVQVFDSGGIERARTTFEYDNYANDGSHAPLVARLNISGLDSGFTTSYLTRGNLTRTTGWILSTSTQLHSYSQYDVAGNVVKNIDARGYATTFEFADRFGAPNSEAQGNTAPSELSGQTSYAFATKVTNALNHISYAQFDYYLGRPVNGEDSNGIVASSSYNNDLDRPTQIKRAIGTGVENQTTFTYDDTLRIVTTTSDRNTNNDNGLVSKTVYDGLGRGIETRQYEGGTNYIVAQQQYDALGRAHKVSNPFRPYLSETAVWTTTVFDALSRVTSVTTPDNALLGTAYNGNAVTVTDQAGKLRRSVTDALGRLTRVDEPDGANNLGSVSSPTQPTSYTYDVLDNLTGVSQGVQTRTFVYDSLKRLTSATNPESGTITYGYDANSNLTSKVDARSITTTFAYDALNRITSKSYNDSPQTPMVTFFYDGQTLPGGAPTFDRGYSTGRLVAVTYGTGSSAGTYRGFDQMGRVVRQYQRTDSVNYLVEASYFANSAMQTQTYPTVPGAVDRRVVTYTNDLAGRLGSLTSSATSYAPAASVSTVSYTAHNGLKTETYGNGLIHAIDYNNRLQATQIKLGTSGNPTSVVSLGYTYGTTNNNGNVLTHTYSGGGLTYTQNFGYDSLNRLTTSSENGSNWSETNGYDRYGNRWIALGGGAQSLYFNTSNNRITGSSYDNAGNLLNDGLHAYTYDAENKIAKVNTVSAYVYDGEGRRVRKLIGENVRMIYGIGGELLSEYSGSTGSLVKEYIYGASGLLATIEPTAVNSNGTRYATPDHLGSPRVVTNSGASVVSRHDYKPFGEELGAGVGGRTTGMGFPGVADGIRQKFTQKERDTETGLDYFLARYYSSTQGRFTSPDEFTGGPDELFTFADDASTNPTFYADLTNPQSINKYQYVYGNPLRFVDPDGHDPEPDPDSQDPCGCASIQKQANDLRDAVRKLDEATSKPLFPITDTIGTSTPPTIGPVALPNDPTVAPVPKVQVTPQAPPAPSQAHPRKKQSTGKNKDHPKDTERPGAPNKQPPGYRFDKKPKPKPKPKPTPEPPKPKPTPKPEIGPDGNPVPPRDPPRP